MAEAKKKVNVVYKGVTPAGVGTWLWVEKPDNSEYGKGKYKAALKIEKGVEANDKYARKIIDLHKAAKGKKDTCPVKDGDALAEENEEKRGNMRGFWVLSAKSKNKPDQIDAKKQPLRASAKSGDFIKLAIAAAEFDTGANKGVTLYLNALQLLERRATSAVDDFDEEDFAADTKEAPSTAFDDDESGSDNSKGAGKPDADDDF